MKDNFNLRTFLIENKLTANSRQIVNEDFISKIRNAVQGPEVDAIFAAAQEEIDNGDAEGMADALAIAADQYYEYYDSKGNEDGTEVAKYIMRSLTQSKSNVQDFSKLKDGDYKNWTVDEKMTQKEDTDIGHQDDEPNMLGASAMETAEYAAKLVKKLQRYDQHDGEVDFPHWWQKKLVLARDYISAAYHYLDSEEKQPAIDQLALENVDKVAAGYPYRQHGNKVIISEPMDDATKERMLGRAKEYGYFAGPNQAGGITITLKQGTYEGQDNEKEIQGQEMVDYIMKNWNWSEDKTLNFLAKSGDQRDALMDLQNVLDQAAQLGDEARQIVKDHFPQELNAGEAYDVFNFGSSTNSYDKTLETLIRDIEMAAEDDDDDYLEEAELPKKFNSGKYSVDKLQKAHDVITGVMKDLAKKYKAGDKSVVSQLKDLTKQKKHVESLLDAKVSGTGKDQELDEAGPGFAHDCAAKVVHETYGKGKCIPEKHTLVKEGKKYVVTHYDVLFENGKTVENIPVQELDIKTTNEHWHKGYKKKK